ncbi:MAG: hypothetical protein EHM33_02090 [Chloroflexi bacterium]|nr:MAG: hypothetical protein EHM33_02090 [Chloroflexota bacterium]
MPESIEWTRIAHDVNGNPRYVCSFFELLTKAEKNAPLYDYQGRQIRPTKYEIAVKRANSIGGRKFHNKQYGGGIVFQSYSIGDTERSIREAVAKAEKE